MRKAKADADTHLGAEPDEVEGDADKVGRGRPCAALLPRLLAVEDEEGQGAEEDPEGLDGPEPEGWGVQGWTDRSVLVLVVVSRPTE